MSAHYAKIVIIGAGISGLGAMVHLKSNGIEDVLVLEALFVFGTQRERFVQLF